MKHLLVLIALAIVLIGAPLSLVAQPEPSIDSCATAPRNGEGNHLLEALCAAIHRIARGEQEITVAYPEDDSASPAGIRLWRNDNGTAIDIDFGGQRIGSSVIARLLSGSLFVPIDRIDLLVFRNATIQGVLDLSNATLEVATRFDNVKFNPQEDSTCGTGESASVRLIAMQAKKRLSFLHSQVCGLLVNGSQLDGGIEIAGTDSQRRSEGSAVGESIVSSMFIIKSTIRSDVLMRWTQVDGNLLIERSTIDSISLDDTGFHGPTAILDNTIGALTSWDTSFHDRMRIANNRVQAALKMAVVTFDQSAPVVRDNAVAGNLQITIRKLDTGTVIDLPHNKVERGSDVWLPEGWRGVLNLNNTAFGSVLSLCMADYDTGKETLVPQPATIALERDLERCRKDRSSEVASEAAAQTPSENEHAIVSLKSAEVATLAWRLPLDCSFLWEGTGLRYGNWAESNGYDPASSDDECPELRGPTEGPMGPTESLMLMRYVMTTDNVDALDTMADYLVSRGRVVESRDIREEAKKANYLNIPAQAGRFDRWSRTLASVVLAPVGFGAKPELALIWLGGLWLISYAIYEIYSLTLRRSWREEIAGGGKSVAGYSSVPGFKQFDRTKDPKEFEIIRYSIDTMLPVINLHTYDLYYTRSRALRVYAGLQHAVGWFLITIFLVSAAIL